MGEVSIGKKRVAHGGSAHAAPGPPAISGIMPPTTPSGQPFTPAPFMYIAKSSALKKGTASTKTTKKGYRICKKDTCMDVEHPANMPAKALEHAPPNGADLVTKVAVGIARITSCGQGSVKVGSVEFAVTGADVFMNLPTDKATVHQSQSKLLEGLSLVMAMLMKGLNPCQVKTTGDPVAVATGEVVDSTTDFTLPGMIELAWTRHYASGRTGAGVFGRCGWTHAFDQRIEPSGNGSALIDADGRTIPVPALDARAELTLRGRGLRITRSLETYEVHALATRTTRTFGPVVRGGPAVLQSLRDRFGNRIELFYEQGRLVRLVDTAGRELHLSHDEKGRIARVAVRARGEEQQQVCYGYSADGDLASVENALGQRDFYAYDGKHRLVEKKFRSGVRFSYTYDEEHGGCVQSSAGGRLQNVELFYEVESRKTVISGNPEPRELSFDDKGELLREASLDGAWAIEYAYDDDQLLVSRKNAAGDEWTFAYDESGRLVKRVEPGGVETTVEYHDDLPVRIVDAGRVTTVIWDHHGAPVRTTYADGLSVEQDFDRFGRLVRNIGAEGVLWTHEYDDEHNLVAETDARGAKTRYEHDALGRMTASVDAIGRRSTWEYDAIGRMVRHVMRDGTEQLLEYDAADNVVKSGDGQGLTIATERFGTGSIARRVMPDGQAWEMAYDVLERLREIKNPKGETYELSYDRAGRLVEEKTFDGQSIRYTYSRRDLLSRVDYDDETWIEYEYDDVGFVAKKISPHGTTTFTRDAASRVVSAVVDEHGGSVAVEITWDELGRPAAVTQGGRTIRYTHGPLNRVVGRELPNGETTRYHYDPKHGLVGVEHEGQKVLLQRDVLGREVRRYVYESGVDVRFGYSDDDRMTEQYVIAPSRLGPAQPAVLLRRKWEYGAHARLRSVHDSRWGSTSYLHDALGFLTEASRGKRVEHFAYDPSGSLVAMETELGGGEPWALRMGNVLARTPDARYEYDLRRRRKKKIDAKTGAVTEYVWDCQDQLREVKLPSGERVLFKYDAFGRRVRKVVIAPLDPASLDPPRRRVVEYVWDFDELAMEIDSERGERVFVHERETFRPLLQRERGETFAYLGDHLGMPRELFDEAGRIAWSAAHSAWGKVIELRRDVEPTGGVEVSSPFRMLGQYADDETGLAYTHHRYFDPDTARWLSIDPLGFHGGPNLLGFDGSPVMQVDPLGLFTRSSFQSFLQSYAGARQKAQDAANAKQSKFSASTTSANDKGDTKNNGGKRKNPISPFGTDRKDDKNIHAEEKLLKQDGKEAIAAGKPHCANCTNDIINSGNVTASPIRPDWQPTAKQTTPKDPNVQW
jgi:RHS repeat-associated protein